MTLLDDSVLYASKDDEGGVSHDRQSLSNRLYASMSPAQQRNHDRWLLTFRVKMWMFKHLPWTQWPLLNYVYGFWTLLFEEGPYQTLKPRWGGITFGWLNDGIKPTVWHTWQQVMHPRGEWDGIYTHGAPRNLKEAEDVRDGFDPRYPNYGKKKEAA